MSLWVRIVDGAATFGPLPSAAVRLDTLQPVNLLTAPQWAEACGYFNVDTVTLADLPPGLTTEQRDQIVADVLEARARQEQRRNVIADLRLLAGQANDKGSDYLDNPWSTPGTDPPPTGPVSLSLHGQQITYLYNRVQETTQWIVGDGTTSRPGIIDVLLMLVEVVVDLIDATDVTAPEV
jgi:hypothetical protein